MFTSLFQRGVRLNLTAFLEELAKHRKTGALLEAASCLGRPDASKQEAKALYKSWADHIAKNNHHAALMVTTALVCLDGNAWVARARNDGLFRASRYGYQTACLKKVVIAALDLGRNLGLTPALVQYLESVLALQELAAPARRIHQRIVLVLKARQRRALKTLLSMVNSAFASNWSGDREMDADVIARWDATEWASAFSRLYMIFRSEFGVPAQSWMLTEDTVNAEVDQVYSALIVDAAKLNEHIDAEVMLDGLPYKAELAGKSVIVSSMDAQFERSVRLGYIQGEIQAMIRAIGTQRELGGEDPVLPSFEALLKEVFARGLLEFASFVEEPVKRVVIALPDLPPLYELLTVEGPYLEEYPLLTGILIENFHEASDGMLRVGTNLTLMDLFKVQRFFSFIELMMREKIKTVEDDHERQTLNMRSTVMVVKRGKLQAMLENLMSAEKVEEIINLLTLPVTSSGADADDYVDVQYRPFLESVGPSGQFLAIAPALVSRSNLPRSVMHASQVKREKAASDDPMQIAVARALREAGFFVREGFEINIEGRKRETDIFCYRDGILLVIECKNAFHPCSPHELRTSYGLVTTAHEQLDIRARWLGDPGNRATLFKSLGWDVPTSTEVRTCVVTANRLFTGYQVGSHPVRQALELVNVLVNGNVGRGPDGEQRRFWRGEAFAIVDLIDYLDGKSILQSQHDAMQPSMQRFNFAGPGHQLIISGWTMDLEEATKRFDEAFPAPSGESSEPGKAVIASAGS